MVLPFSGEIPPITVELCSTTVIACNYARPEVYVRARRSIDGGIRRTKHFCSKNTVTNFILTYCALGFGYFYILVFVLQDIDVDKGFCFPLVLTLVTGLFVWFPFYFWVVRARASQLLVIDSREIQRVEDPIPIEMPVEKPPLYETLVFTTPESAMASLPPPSYEVAIQASEIPQILQPDYNSRDANVAASLCPVHQQNSTRHPDITLLI
ncbi:uncharacterized protein LOC124367425 isoform X4 [Homalodisca vitripennis]|uniref:uncharacterized protein LOC124367425 isoform X4 n=1 Tax=Homalodisca vitripennis TaxID=197043 RepID=UPI001EEA8ABC|nr:uncharacterized protein LOC124367425 isoform X4 [Homalodisca vitripennis]